MTDFQEVVDRKLAQNHSEREARAARKHDGVSERDRTINEVIQMCQAAVKRLREEGIVPVPVVKIPTSWGFRSAVDIEPGRSAWSLGDWTITSALELWTDQPVPVSSLANKDKANERRILKAFDRSHLGPADHVLPTPTSPLVSVTNYHEGRGIKVPALKGWLIHLPINDGELSITPIDESHRQLTVPRFQDVFAARIAAAIDKGRRQH